MKKIVMSVVGLAFMCLTLVGCGEQITSGMVVDKKYSPAHSYVTQQCSSYNQSGGCTMYVPITHNVPDKWTVTIHGKNSSGESDSSTYRVSESNFNEINIGDQISYDKETNSITIM